MQIKTQTKSEPRLIQLRRAPLESEARYLWRYREDYINREDGSQKLQIRLYGHEIIKETEKGFWIIKLNYSWMYRSGIIPREHQRFVLKCPDTSEYRGVYRPPKRWAYEDKDHAWLSFKIRKEWHEVHLERDLARVKRVNQMIEDGDFERRFPSVNNPFRLVDDY